LPNKKPNAKKITPKDRDLINNLNALENLNWVNKSYTNVEKVLKLPKKPIEKNNTN